MTLPSLQTRVWRANLDLVKHGLVTLTWGNASGLDRERRLVVIKPSGVRYSDLRPDRMAVRPLEGEPLEEGPTPSSDTPTHLEIYRGFSEIGGVVHTHSRFATMFAQAERPIPCLGTTHADFFHGEVPLTRRMTQGEVKEDYEKHTGTVILERFARLDPLEFPGVLVAGHGVFTWGRNPEDAIRNAVALEAIAEIAKGTLQLNPKTAPLPGYLMEKHYRRKHGPEAYYGQKKTLKP